MTPIDVSTLTFRKSTYSETEDCVEVAFAFRKSSYSKADENCVEVAHVPEAVAVRDSKDPGGPMLVVSRAAFARFLRTLASS